MSQTTNYYKEYRDSSELLEKVEVLNLLTTLTESYLNEKGSPSEKANNSHDDIHLKAIVELFSNILEELDPKKQEEFNQFLEESKDDNVERFQKMKFVISGSSGLQGKALKKASLNVYSWLNLDEENDHSEFQTVLYNLATEIEQNQKIVLDSYNKQNN